MHFADVTLNVGFNAGTQPFKEASRALKGKGRSHGKSVQYTMEIIHVRV